MHLRAPGRAAGHPRVQDRPGAAEARPRRTRWRDGATTLGLGRHDQERAPPVAGHLPRVDRGARPAPATAASRRRWAATACPRTPYGARLPGPRRRDDPLPGRPAAVGAGAGRRGRGVRDRRAQAAVDVDAAPRRQPARSSSAARKTERAAARHRAGRALGRLPAHGPHRAPRGHRAVRGPVQAPAAPRARRAAGDDLAGPQPRRRRRRRPAEPARPRHRRQARPRVRRRRPARRVRHARRAAAGLAGPHRTSATTSPPTRPWRADVGPTLRRPPRRAAPQRRPLAAARRAAAPAALRARRRARSPRWAPDSLRREIALTPAQPHGRPHRGGVDRPLRREAAPARAPRAQAGHARGLRRRHRPLPGHQRPVRPLRRLPGARVARQLEGRRERRRPRSRSATTR